MPTHSACITHCSRSFLEAWGLPGQVPDISGEVLPLGSPPLSEALTELGMSPSTLLDLCETNAVTEVRLPEHFVISKIRRTEVLDDAQRKIGVILTCDNRNSLSVSKEVWSRASQSRKKLGILSPREAEILELVFQGSTNKAIGKIADISEKTVEKHRSSIMRKLGTRNMAHLIRSVTEAQMIGTDVLTPNKTAENIGS